MHGCEVNRKIPAQAGIFLFLLENIQGVIGIPDQILSLTGSKMVFQKQFIHGIVHLIHCFPHVIGVPVGCDKMELGNGKSVAQSINILFSMQLKEIPRMGERVKGFRIDHTLFNDIVNLPADKAKG